MKCYLHKTNARRIQLYDIHIRGVPKPMYKKVSEKMMGNFQVHAKEDSGDDLHEDPRPLVPACYPTELSYTTSYLPHLLCPLPEYRNISFHKQWLILTTANPHNLEIFGISTDTLFNDYFSKVGNGFCFIYEVRPSLKNNFHRIFKVSVNTILPC